MLRMPGSILMSRLKVYDTPASDGQRGGTPHVHLLCTEMYTVLDGSGAVEIINAQGFTCVELQPGAALVFSPGTVHRLINPVGNLEILVMMQNSGLPERGDNVVCFREEWLSSDTAYGEAMQVQTLEQAYLRRDRGVEGFLQLKDAFAQNSHTGQAVLRKFYQLAEQRTAKYRTEWLHIIENGALASVNTTLQQLQALSDHNTDYLLETQHQLIHVSDPKLGFCGHLHRYFDPTNLAAEGIRQL